MNLKNDKPVELAAAEEKQRITRQVIAWLNTFPGLPVKQVSYGGLTPNKPGIALLSPQGAVIRKKYITGSYLGEYPFSLIYRIVKPGDSIDKRLQADELLDSLGGWAAKHRPEIGLGIQARRVEVSAWATLASWPGVPTEFDIEVFDEIVEKIIPAEGGTLRFRLRCGLELKEAMPT